MTDHLPPTPPTGWQQPEPLPKGKGHKKRNIVIGATVAFVAIAVLGSPSGRNGLRDGISDGLATPAPTVSLAPEVPIVAPASPTPAETPQQTASPASETTPTLEPQLSVGQQNAIAQAQSYLDYAAFSHSGLIDQLVYEGFSKSEATFAVDAIAVDWNQQAYLKAKEYLGYSSFSLSGLIDQLVYEGFTTSQAKYGANKAYK